MKNALTDQATHEVISSVVSSWRQSEAPDTQVFLETHPEYRDCRSIVVRLAYEEFCLRRESGEQVAASTFCERFPTVRNSLRKVIDVHELFSELDVDSVSEDAWPAIGDNFLGFELLDEIGRGAIARVFLASQLSLGRRVVVVKVSPRGTDEADTQGKLNHPNIVPVYSCHLDDESGLSAVCMPYQGSATLLDLLDEIYGTPEGYVSGTSRTEPPGAEVILRVGKRCLHPQFVAEDAHDREYVEQIRGCSLVEGIVRLGLQLAESLSFTHRRGVLHRDLKPSNVLLTPTGRPKLLDFNLSSDEEIDLTRVGGTLPYMPPEQVQEVFLGDPDQQVDAQSDIYSLGVILYQLLSGSLPFGELAHARNNVQEAAEYLLQRQRSHLFQSIASTTRLDVPQELAEFVESCLSFDKQARPPSAEALATRLQSILDQLAAARQVEPARSDSTNDSTGWQPRTMVAMAACLVVAAVAGIAWDDTAQNPALNSSPASQAAMTSVDAADGETQLIAKAVRLYREQKYEPAAFEFKTAAEQSVLHAPLYQAFAAHSYFKALNPAGAINAYRTLVELAPSSDTLNNLGYCLLLTGEVDESLDCLEAAVAADFTNWKAHYNLASWYLRFGDGGGECLAEIERAIELAPKPHALLHFDAARAYALNSQTNSSFELDVERHLARAFELGCPWEEIERHPRHFGPMSDCEWLANLRASCSRVEGRLDRTALHFAEPDLAIIDAVATGESVAFKSRTEMLPAGNPSTAAAPRHRTRPSSHGAGE